MNPKHQQNKQKKLRTLANKGAVCSRCGAPLSRRCSCQAPPILPSDPKWAGVVQQYQALVVATARPASRVRAALQTPPPTKIGPFNAPQWLENIRSGLAYSCYVNPDHLIYKGISKRVSAKAGKRKTESHCFIIEPPLPLTHEGESVFLWHGSVLRNSHGILSQGLRPSTHGMLGPGVYLGTLAKARNYMRTTGWGLLLYVEVVLGNVVDGVPGETKRSTAVDTYHCAPGRYKGAWGGRVRQEEWCVLDPTRIVIREIHIARHIA